MLLHDATQAMHLNSVNRKKYIKKIVILTTTIIVLTDALSIVLTGSLTYFYTTTQALGIAAPGVAAPGVAGDSNGGVQARKMQGQKNGGKDLHVSIQGTTLGKQGRNTTKQTYLGSNWGNS